MSLTENFQDIASKFGFRIPPVVGDEFQVHNYLPTEALGPVEVDGKKIILTHDQMYKLQAHYRDVNKPYKATRRKDGSFSVEDVE